MSTWLEVNSFLPDSAPLLGSYTSADQWIFFFPFLGCSYFWEGNIWSWELQAPGTRQPTASTAAKCFSCPTASLPAPQSPQPCQSWLYPTRHLPGMQFPHKDSVLPAEAAAALDPWQLCPALPDSAAMALWGTTEAPTPSPQPMWIHSIVSLCRPPVSHGHWPGWLRSDLGMPGHLLLLHWRRKGKGQF